MQTTSFNEVLDIHIGKRGTKKREKFEQELRIELLGVIGKYKCTNFGK